MLKRNDIWGYGNIKVQYHCSTRHVASQGETFRYFRSCLGNIGAGIAHPTLEKGRTRVNSKEGKRDCWPHSPDCTGALLCWS
jgi:hypothetical protein